MSKDLKKNSLVKNLVNTNFKTNIKVLPFPKGLSIGIIKKIIRKTKAPLFLSTFRTKSFKL
tara:strand:+ start:268 stop:450 length:183 start_codon:yes stop_codon:yes gene_type:complete